jgi:hypothetical protein
MSTDIQKERRDNSQTSFQEESLRVGDSLPLTAAVRTGSTAVFEFRSHERVLACLTAAKRVAVLNVLREPLRVFPERIWMDAMGNNVGGRGIVDIVQGGRAPAWSCQDSKIEAEKQKTAYKHEED